MTYLTICQDVARILRVGEGDLGSVPGSTVGQVGVMYEITQFVTDAYEQVQTDQRYWNFMRTQGTFPLSASTRTYTRAAIQGTLSTYDRIIPSNVVGDQFFLIYTTATGVGDQTQCWYVPYEDWRGFYDVGTRPLGKPGRFTERPDGTLEFDPTPDKAYTVTLDYLRTVATFASDSTVPIVPAEYTKAIVWRAVLNYYETRGGEAYQEARAMREWKTWINNLRTDQLPTYTVP